MTIFIGIKQNGVMYHKNIVYMHLVTLSVHENVINFSKCSCASLKWIRNENSNKNKARFVFSLSNMNYLLITLCLLNALRTVDSFLVVNTNLFKLLQAACIVLPIPTKRLLYISQPDNIKYEFLTQNSN